MGVASLDRPAGFQALLRVCEGQLGNWIELVRRAQPGPVSRLLQRIRAISKSWRWKAGVIGVALIAAILAIPFTYKIKCDCQVQPHTRRFVVAPFEGRLEESLVRQGELVRQGQVLARMDGREIRLDLAAVAAERSRAGKKRDSAMATQKVADAQAAKLEMDRLDLKIQLLEQRIDNLEVRSPIDGVVISGDLERAEGAPLSIGQTLFEVAPLDKMIVELAIPEEEIWYVGENLNATVHLDAYPQHEWTASITKIHPRAEVRQSRNAFIGELQVENNGGTLRPGMNGKAKIAGPRRALAWNLFHKPADWLARTLEF
jgi:RND family efflux transporter MFP subunit